MIIIDKTNLNPLNKMMHDANCTQVSDINRTFLEFRAQTTQEERDNWQTIYFNSSNSIYKDYVRTFLRNEKLLLERERREKELETAPKRTLTKKQEYIKKLMIQHGKIEASKLYTLKKPFKDDIESISSAVRSEKQRIRSSCEGEQKESRVKYLKQTSKQNTQQYPYDTKRGKWIGIEIECFAPNEVLEEKIEGYSELDDSDRRHEIHALFRSAGVRRACIKYDGSISPKSNCTAFEINLLITDDSFIMLKKTCDVLEDLEAQVNESCGLHVHLDQRDVFNNSRLLNRRVKKLSNAIPFLASLVPKSRLDNSYCQLKHSYTDRYTAINCTALDEHKSIEIRLHSGTTNFKKILYWVLLLKTICYNERAITPKLSSVDDFAMFYDVKQDVLLHAEKRAAKFERQFSKLNLTENEM